jgi:hypothetical protein
VSRWIDNVFVCTRAIGAELVPEAVGLRHARQATHRIARAKEGRCASPTSAAFLFVGELANSVVAVGANAALAGRAVAGICARLVASAEDAKERIVAIVVE